jgi:Anti-sigma-K factor rskA
VSGEHEQAQELLAAHALHALDDVDLATLERLVRTHVNGCLECRNAMSSFEAVSADLALAAAPVDPPGSMAGRLRRDIRSREPVGVWARSAVAASLLLVLTSLALWNAHLNGLVSRAETSQQLAGEVLDTMSRPESRVVSLGTEGTASVSSQVVAAYVPGRGRMYLFGSMPLPAPDRVYQIWLGRRGIYASAGTFVPESSGRVVVRIMADPDGFDAVLITEEPAAGSSSPSGRHVLTASL